MKQGYVYIMTNKRNGTLYVGVTSDLIKRVYEHRKGLAEGFAKQYGLKILVWYEVHDDINEAIRREKQIKAWKREWKLQMIEDDNPEWRDLYSDIVG